MFAIILSVYLLAGGLYARLTPAWQAPDEPAHYNYVQFLDTQPGLPELVAGCYDQAYLSELTSRRFPPELPVDNLCYEFHQPPLYYLLNLPIFVLTDGSLLALRLFAVILGSGVLVIAFWIGRTIFPDRPEIAYGTMAFVAFVPMHTAILASANNDALAGLIFAALLLLLVRRLAPSSSTAHLLNGRRQFQDDLLLGTLLGLGLITKMTIYIAIPLIAVALWLGSITRKKGQNGRPDWSRLIKQAVLIYGLALLIASPWYIRNGLVYGNFDILGLNRHDIVVIGQRRTADFIAEVGWINYTGTFFATTFRSFWGQFGWMAVPMDGRTYQFLAVLSLMALGGLIGFGILDFRFWIFFVDSERFEGTPMARLSRKVLSPHAALPGHLLLTGQRQALALLALTVILTVLAYGWYNITFLQLQGRYLFPALIPVGLFFSLGLIEAFESKWAWWLAVALAAVLLWVGLASTLKGGLDKWAVLIIGAALTVAVARAWLARRSSIPATWLLALCLGALALLALLAPFWFVIPYLRT